MISVLLFGFLQRSPVSAPRYSERQGSAIPVPPATSDIVSCICFWPSCIFFTWLVTAAALLYNSQISNMIWKYFPGGAYCSIVSSVSSLGWSRHQHPVNQSCWFQRELFIIIVIIVVFIGFHLCWRHQRNHNLITHLIPDADRWSSARSPPQPNPSTHS